MKEAQGLKNKATSGVFWVAVQQYSTTIIGFISGIILARLLTPYDYGCIGMLAIFMALAGSFVDGGFGSALIQKKSPSQEDYSTIFYWNFGVSVLMYLILFLCAPAISRFYSLPILSPVLRVQGLVLFVYSFNIIQKNQLKKRLNFKVLAIVNLSTALISLLVTIIMAYKGYGVWALVAQNMLSSVIPAVVFWFYLKWRPLPVFSFKSLKELFSFGFFMLLTHLLNNFSKKVQGLLIGKFYSLSTMGYYSKAISTEDIASNSISSVMTQVTYPLYAEAQNDLSRLSNMIRRLTMTISYITFPILFLLVLLAKPVFLILYSEKWLASVPYFQILCFSGMGACLTAINTQSIAAIGKSKLMFIWTLVKRTVGLSAIVGGLFLWGMKGLLIGVVFNSWFSYFVNICLVSKYIHYSWKRQVLDLVPSALVSLIAASLSWLAGSYLKLSIYPKSVVIFLVFVAVYLGWSLIFRPESYTYFISVIPERFRFWESHK